MRAIDVMRDEVISLIKFLETEGDKALCKNITIGVIHDFFDFLDEKFDERLIRLSKELDKNS